MKLVITISDVEDGHIRFEEERFPYSGEQASSVTPAAVASDDLLRHLQTLATPCEEA